MGAPTEKYHFITNAKKKGRGFFFSLGGIFKSFVIVPNHGAFGLTHNNKKKEIISWMEQAGKLITALC